MAAFSFPENPSNGDTTENTATGLVYVFRSSPSPGKWEVQMVDSQADFVNVTGDTMTGPLILNPANVLASTDAVIKIDNSSGNASSGALLEIDGSSSTNIFNLYNNAFSSHLQFFQIFTPGPTVSGGVTGFSLHGKNVSRPGDLTESLLQQIRNSNSQTADSLRYDGLVVDDKDIANKAYVDTAAVLKIGGSMTGPLIINDTNSDPLNINSGKFIVGANGDTSVNNLNVFTALDNKGKISFSSTGPQYIDIYGSNLKSLFIRAGNNTTDSGILNALSINSSGVNIVSNVTKNRGATGSKDFVIQGTTASDPSNTAGELFYVFRNTPIGGGAGDAINYFGYTDGVNNIQTKGSVTTLIPTVLASTSVTDLTVTTSIAGAANKAPGNLEIDCNIVDISSRITLPTYVNCTTATNDVNFGLGTNNTIYFRNDVGIGGTGSGSIAYLNDAGLVFKRSMLLSAKTSTDGITLSDSFQTGVPSFGSPTPSAILFDASVTGSGAIRVNGNGSTASFSLGLTKSSSGSNTTRMLYATDSKIWSYATDFSNGRSIVTVDYLKQNGLITTATFTSTGSGDNQVLTQTSVNVAAQMELDGRTSVGRGFTLKGCTIAQPTNTSAICLDLYHPISAAAQLLYDGDTTGNDACVQTKASVATKITETQGTWVYINSSSSNSGSSLNGYFVVNYRKNTAGEVTLLVNASNNSSTNIEPNAIVAVLPTGYRPVVHYTKVFTLIDENYQHTAIAIVKSNGAITIRSVTGNATKFYGQCTFNIYNPS